MGLDDEFLHILNQFEKAVLVVSLIIKRLKFYQSFQNM